MTFAKICLIRQWTDKFCVQNNSYCTPKIKKRPTNLILLDALCFLSFASH